MHLKCCICREIYDNQYISKYGTTDREMKVIEVCENCYSDLSVYEDETNELYILVNGHKFYNMEVLT